MQEFVSWVPGDAVAKVKAVLLSIDGDGISGNCDIQDMIEADTTGSFHHVLKEQAESVVVVDTVFVPEHSVEVTQDVEHDFEAIEPEATVAQETTQDENRDSEQELDEPVEEAEVMLPEKDAVGLLVGVAVGVCVVGSV